MANGLVVAAGRVPGLVVTLAALYIIRGIDILIVGGNEVTAQTLPFGGSGSAVGAAVGALLLASINSALNVLGFPQLWLEAIPGFLLLLAITLDRIISVRLMTALRRRSPGVGT